MSLTEIEKYLFYNLTRSCIDQKRPIGSKFLAKKIKHKKLNINFQLQA
jgi:transcriptional regulator of heat shock response